MRLELNFETSDHHGLTGLADFKCAFYQKSFLYKWIEETKSFEVSNSPYQLLDHNSYKRGFCQITSLLKCIEVNQNV